MSLNPSEAKEKSISYMKNFSVDLSEKIIQTDDLKKYFNDITVPVGINIIEKFYEGKDELSSDRYSKNIASAALLLASLKSRAHKIQETNELEFYRKNELKKMNTKVGTTIDQKDLCEIGSVSESTMRNYRRKIMSNNNVKKLFEEDDKRYSSKSWGGENPK